MAVINLMRMSLTVTGITDSLMKMRMMKGAKERKRKTRCAARVLEFQSSSPAFCLININVLIDFPQRDAS